jgi:shikimate dehydrogenase
MPAGALGDVKDSIDLVVNSTPLGMYPNVDDTPWPEVAPFPRCSLVYDLVYNPPVTRFMRQARREGIMAANGLGMLIHQAALAFTIWTGRAAPIEVMRKTALRG